ncbi:receptor protein-tyrosine kinase sevenless isoform 1-T5 [Cochliomyia hominivorax]
MFSQNFIKSSLINSLMKLIIITSFVFNCVNCETDEIIESTTPLATQQLLEIDGGEDDVELENDFKINQILTNLSIFNDDSHEYDTSMVLMLENVTHKCLERCMEEESSYLNDFGLKCKLSENRPECYRARCFKGCELWWQALKEFEPCQEACSSTQFYPFDLPCISACETTQRQYWHLQRLHVERLLTATAATKTTSFQPQLLHDNETLNTLTLKWPITTAMTSLLPALHLASRPFNIQYQYVLRATPSSAPSAIYSPSSSSSTTDLTVNDTPDMEQQQLKQQQQKKFSKQQDIVKEDQQDDDGSDNVGVDDNKDFMKNDGDNNDDMEDDAKRKPEQEQWWNLSDYNCNENFECDIMDGLMPYTSYKFRFELPFGNNLYDVLYSPASDVYTTPAMGRPISAPIITQFLALDESHIAIFWQKGKFTNGPLTHYKVVLKSSDTSEIQEKDIKHLLPPSSFYYIFDNLLPSTTYSLHLSMLNEEGEGPSAEINITTKALQKSKVKLDDLNTLIIAGEYSVIMKSLDPLVESHVLYKSEEFLVDFDVHQYSKRLFVVNKKGALISLHLDDAANYTVLNSIEEDTGFVPSKVAIDWLNQKLYVAGRTSSSDIWQLKRLNFNGTSVETVISSLTPLKHLQIDPLNGWIFASNEQFQLCRINLYSHKVEYFSLPFEVEHISNQYRNYLLTAYNAKERAIHELSYDAQYNKKTFWEISSSFQGDVLWYLQFQDWLIMSNGSYLLRQHLNTQEVDVMIFKEIEWCWKIIPLMSGGLKGVVQPLPRPLKEPDHLQAVVSSNTAKISWQPPLRVKEFQSKAAWHKWEYELDILDVSSNNAFNIRSIKSTFFQVERLQANNLYKIKVRAMLAGVNRPGLSSEISEWSQELMTRTWPMGEHKFLWATARGLAETQDFLQLAEIKALESLDIKNFKQVNSSLFYIDRLKHELKCFNLMNPEIRCGFQAVDVYSVDYDWRGGKLYWSDVGKNCIVRSDLKGELKELLPIYEARLIKLDSWKGYIYYATDSRLVRRKLSGGLPPLELEYYHVNGNGEVIRGFTLDFAAQQIYWWVELQEGKTKLFRSDMDFVKMEELLELKEHENILQDSFNLIPEIESFIWLRDEGKKVVLASKDKLKLLTEFPTPLKETTNFVQLYRDAANYQDLSVVLEPVEKESVYITEGYWDDFNIKWSVVNAPENFTVFYKVLISTWPQDATNILTFEVQQPIVRITEFKMAGLLINVTITPHTLWAAGAPITVELKTPSAAPKQPKNLRVFVEQIMEPLQKQANITALVRWDSPDNISSEKEVFYKVYCWLKDDLHSVKDIEDLGRKSHEVRFYNLLKEESYMFQVQAFSLTRSKGGEKTSLLNHFINPESQAIPKLLFTTPEYIAELDLDLNETKKLVYTSSEVEHLALMWGEQRLIWVNENVELMSYQPGAAALKLARMRAEVLSLTVDWIMRKVYWAEMSGEKENLVDIYELDLNLYEGKVMLGKKIFSLDQGKLLKNLIVLPYSRSLMWLEFEGLQSTNCSLQGRNLTDFSQLKFKQHLFYMNMFEGSLLAEMESVNLVDSKGRLYAYELQRHLTTNLKIPLMENEATAKFQRDSGYIYSLQNNTIKAFNRRKHNLEYSRSLKDVKLIKSFNYQEYPKRECLIMEYDQEMGEFQGLEQLFVKEVDENFITLQLMRKNPFENCKVAIPGLKYTIKMRSYPDFLREYKQSAGLLNITDLKPFTNYSLKISVSSYYQQKYALEEMMYPEFTLRTQEGTPSQPLNFTVQALSPSEISVVWLEPAQLNAESVTYQLYWQALNSSLTSHKIVEGFELILSNLEASQDYQIWLEVYSKPSKLNVSEKLLVTTFPEPESLHLLEKEAYNLTLQWQANTDYDSVILECRPLTQELEDAAFSIDITNITDNITITNLEPKTKYEFFFKLQFANVPRPYIWPELPNAYFIYETLGDAPGRPGQPQIEHITGEIFKVFWEPAKDNGAPIIEYSLEALKSRHQKRIRRHLVQHLPNKTNTSSITTLAQMPWVEELQPIEDKWLTYCNTSELSCIVRELHTMRYLMFRVRARNEPYGWGPYSEDSERVLEPFVSPQKRNSLVLAIIAPAAIVTTCVIILFVIRKVQKRRLKAKQLLAKSRPSIWSNLSTMQQQMAARNRTFSMTSNSTMYTGGPLSDADIALLPHINWSQITLLNFLGSGAFGEVYEGMLKHEEQGQMEKVAIKSLRKGASEFAELLQEAQLMSNFKHDNIVRLIGVCCDTESISIIMEHMEGGDLLSYLRESRPNSTKPVASLQLLDLMSMCIDVATGMAYLEDMHFVHRDLACRNCLVSSRIPSKRTVKIGDFGLARDIYKSDYYRKEGEALMPVRWMAPESLVDGVFTTQSDVWAFGVLCWEILTLGQQPYAARNNFEVLNFVKEGGRLEQPDNCPDKLFALMSSCWLTEPDERPSFRKCVNALLAIKTDVRRVSLGYNIDDSDYAMYANQHGIVLSSFLATPSTHLNKVQEEKEEEEEEKPSEHRDLNHKYEIKQNSLNTKNEESSKPKTDSMEVVVCDKNDLKVRFNNNVSMKESEDHESLNDESNLIDTKLYRIQENPDYYVNEGVSRL